MKTLNRMQIRLLALALAAVGGAAFAQQSDAVTAPQVRAQLEAQGYTDIDDVEFKDGMWKADARSANGKRVDVRLNARTGEIYPDDQVANLSEADVRAQLAAKGYTNVHDVDFDDGVWKAEGEDRAGKKVEVRLDASSGAIIGKEKD